MIETILQVENNQYPFQERTSKEQIINVQDIQNFNNINQLLEKKNEMVKKNKIITSPYIIKLLKIYQEDLSLHFVYEHVPYSLASFILKHYKSSNQKVVEMSGKLFIKKISYELTMLISYLANMKIQIDLSMQNIGITQDQKIKVFMNSRSRMGHKTEVSLVAFYSNRKERILHWIQQMFKTEKQAEEPAPNFYIKGNKLFFPQTELNQSINNETASLNDSQNSYNLFESKIQSCTQNHSTASCIDPKLQHNSSNLRQTTHNFSKYFKPKQGKKSSRSMNKDPKVHKNSFNFGARKSRKESHFSQFQDDDKSDTKSYTHSKSIRIQLQQKQDGNEKKKRKDSYKVKITTFHQYQMDDCDPQDLFGNVPKNQQDVFEYFSKQNAQKQKQFCKTQKSENDYQQKSASNLHKTPFIRKQSMPQHGYMSAATSTRTLEQKVRLAKQKAQSVLSKYMTSKKKAASVHEDIRS